MASHGEFQSPPQANSIYGGNYRYMESFYAVKKFLPGTGQFGDFHGRLEIPYDIYVDSGNKGVWLAAGEYNALGRAVSLQYIHGMVGVMEEIVFEDVMCFVGCVEYHQDNIILTMMKAERVFHECRRAILGYRDIIPGERRS